MRGKGVGERKRSGMRGKGVERKTVKIRRNGGERKGMEVTSKRL